MKNLKPFILGSLMIMTIAVTPLISLADNEKNESTEGGKVEQHTKIESRSEDKSHSIWGKLSNLFVKNKANITVATSATAPRISGITAPTVLKVNETGTWAIKASDPQNESLSYSVDWGDTASVSPTARMAPAFVQTSTFTHAYTNPGEYRITFTVSNSLGEKSTSSTTVHIVGTSVSTPVISNVIAQSRSPQHANITWTTDRKSTSNVWYSTTSPVVTTGNANVSRNGKTKNHKIAINNLQPNTTYYVVVGSENSAGKTMSSEISFKTKAQIDTSTPVITSVTGSQQVTAGDTATVTVNAYDPNNGTLSYSADWGDTTPSMLSRMFSFAPVFVQSSTFTHVYTAPGEYTATFTAENSAGLKSTSSLTITVKPRSPIDTTAPIMSNMSIQTGASTSTISWTTNEASSSKVFYSTTTPVDVTTATSVSNDALVTSHSLNITGLSANTLYHIIVVSSDGSSNKTMSSETSFTTTAL